MTFEILVVLVVLVAAVVLFVTEKLRVDLVALLVLLTLTLAGVIEGEHAFDGFSNHAVITIASVLILSGGLQRTGVANLVGRQVLRLAGSGERRLIVVMMTTVGLLSGIMNDIGVTALLLPVVVDIARRLGRPPSKLLMPLAFGSLLGGEGREALDESKAPVSAAIMATVLASVASGWLPIYVAAPAGAALMVLSRCLSMEDAYRFVEWKALLLIAGMLSLGLAMQESGAAGLIAHSVLGTAASYGTTALIAGLFLITALSAQVMPTAAVAVLISPIALSSAAELQLSPHALLMVVAIASSCAFMSPVGHPVNLLVMGVGGYRFTDYTRVGLPLTFLIFLIVLFVLPLVWPL